MNASSKPREAPLTFEMIAPAVRESRIIRFAVSGWNAFDAAFRQSRLQTVVHEAQAIVRAAGPGTLTAQCAWIVATAAATNLFMLLVVERYHFPRRTALILPALVAVLAIVAYVLSADIARAVEDKQGG
jgi:hypothetical protein